jgi:acetoin utilization deacetylase AcuC-like enzyme
MQLENADYAWAGDQIRACALRLCKGLVVSTLEGGYDLTALTGSVAAYVGAMTRD